jgi:hypothetical protein
MEQSNYHINPRQLRRMIILETGTIGCLFVTLWSDREQGLITILLSVIGSLLYGSILIAIGRTDGGYYSMTEHSLPGFLWRLIWLIYIIRFAIRGAWMLSYLEYMIHETLYDGSRWMILIPLLVVCVYAGARSLEGRARLVELMFWWVILPLVLIFLIGLRRVDVSALVPNQEIEVSQLLRGDYKLMALFLPLEFLLFRVSAIGRSKQRNANQMAWICGMQGIVLSGLWMLLVYVVTVGILGVSWGQSKLLGVSYAMEQIGIRGGGLERVDILILLFWLIGGILTLSAYLFQGQQLLQRICTVGAVSGSMQGSLWAVIGQALLTFAIYFCFDSPEEWSSWYLNFACYVDLPVSIGLPVLIWCIWRCRRRKEFAVWNKNIKLEEPPVKQFKSIHIIGIVTIVGMCSLLTGCQKQASIENRAYVEALHVNLSEDEYEFRCELAYIDQDVSTDTFEMTVQSDSGSAGAEEVENAYEYTSQAGDIAEFNEEFYQLTGCRFDYSHLQGIYLERSIYEQESAGAVLEDIWQETKAVLTTPVYEEGKKEKAESDVTLGDWLKYQSLNNDK